LPYEHLKPNIQIERFTECPLIATIILLDLERVSDKQRALTFKKNITRVKLRSFYLQKVFAKGSYLLADGLASCEKTSAITHLEEASFT